MSSSELLKVLKGRFEANMHRHPQIGWDEVAEKLGSNPKSLLSLGEMEKTGGEPDVIGRDLDTGEIIFCDCAKESPEGRRNCCYDRKAQELREKKGVFPQGNVLDLAAAMGAELLDEEQYRQLQTLEEFDLKTSSWIRTPASIRDLGGALFADRRYGRVFTYHNSAPSFYSARGFRVLLRI